MSQYFATTIKQCSRMKSLPATMIVSPKDRDLYYNHFTLRVKTLSEYIDVVSRLAAQIRKDAWIRQLVYRGHSDASSKYQLIPSIARKENYFEGLENSMVSEMQTLRPEEFSGISSDFDLLSKMQHFGIPTRLLDFTYNPLIALYFACCNEKKTDGRVICSLDTSSESSMEIIEKICGTYRYPDLNEISLDRLLGNVSLLMKYALHTFEPLMAKPKYLNDRIKHQAAVFMVFPNMACDYRSRMIVLGKKHGDELEYRVGFTIDDEESKRLEYVRNEPNVYGDSFIVEAKNLRDLLLHYEKQNHDFSLKKEFGINPKYHFIFHDRFNVVNSIQELSPEMISRFFISIIVESKSKKQILSDLSCIGVDEAFVFPELEYTAKKIKNQFF